METYNLEGVEVRVNIAVAREVGIGSAPAGRIGTAAGDVRGNAATREEPDADGITGPLCRIHTTASVVEVGTKRLGGARRDLASRVCGLSRRIHIAVGRDQATREAAAGDAAAITGVEGHVIVALVVDTFNDVNLAVVGPV